MPAIFRVVGMMSCAISLPGCGILSKNLSTVTEKLLVLYGVPPIVIGWAAPSLKRKGVPVGLLATVPAGAVVLGTGMFCPSILHLTLIGPPAFPPIVIRSIREPSIWIKF